MNDAQNPIPPPIAYRHCYRISELVSRSQDDPLSVAQKSLVYTHLLMCKNCRTFAKNTQTLSAMMKSYKARSDR